MIISARQLLVATFIATTSCTLSVASELPKISVSEDGITVGGISISKNGVVIGGTDTDTDSAPSIEEGSSANVFNGDYTRGDFSGQNLAGARFSNSKFTRAKFDGANLQGAVFENSDFTRASFIGACMYGVVFINSNFTRANMTGAVLTEMSNNSSNFTRAIMKNVERDATCSNDSDGTVEDLDDTSPTTARVEITSADSITTALLKGVDSSVSLTVNFATNSDQISDRADAQIGEIFAALSGPDFSGTTILIEGHTDNKGSRDYNIDLSFRRASSVKRKLVSEYGLDTRLLTVNGLGETQPITSNATRSGRSLNRRVTLVNKGMQYVE